VFDGGYLGVQTAAKGLTVMLESPYISKPCVSHKVQTSCAGRHVDSWIVKLVDAEIPVFLEAPYNFVILWASSILNISFL
jgi:hypothetical protein